MLSETPEATQQLAVKIAKHAQPGTILLLQADLGGGKTTFVQGLGLGLGIPGVINSPTFVLLQEYWEGRIPLFHCDLYRLDPDSVDALGLEEIWHGSGITAIEWPERLPKRPERWLHLEFEIVGDQSRRVIATCQGEKHRQLWEQVMAP